MGSHPSESFQTSPATRLAERLLAEAVARPSLIGRTYPLAAMIEAHETPFNALALLSDPALDVHHYLEELVSIAVNAAERADAVSEQAHMVTRRARRGMVAVACFGALGLLVGAAGLVAGRAADFDLARIRGEISALRDAQRGLADQLAVATPATGAAAETGSPEPAAAATMAPVTVPQTPPAVQSPIYSYEAWPDSRRAPSRRPVATRANRAVVPSFFTDLQRNLHSVFR